MAELPCCSELDDPAATASIQGAGLVGAASACARHRNGSPIVEFEDCDPDRNLYGGVRSADCSSRQAVSGSFALHPKVSAPTQHVIVGFAFTHLGRIGRGR